MKNDKKNQLQIRNSTSEFLIFTSQNGEELQPESVIRKFRNTAADLTIRKFRIVQAEGTREVTRNLEFRNLDATIFDKEMKQLEETAKRIADQPTENTE